MEAMGKMYRGNVPKEEDGWVNVGTCYDIDNSIEWFVFSQAQKHSEDWQTYKIVVNGRAMNKANYWMVRNNNTGQIGFASDYAKMRSDRPHLHAKVESLLRLM
jgi:hypothetical protein